MWLSIEPPANEMHVLEDQQWTQLAPYSMLSCKLGRTKHCKFCIFATDRDAWRASWVHKCGCCILSSYRILWATYFSICPMSLWVISAAKTRKINIFNKLSGLKSNEVGHWGGDRGEQRGVGREKRIKRRWTQYVECLMSMCVHI